MRIATWILLLGVFVVSAMVGAPVKAQTVPAPANRMAPRSHAAAESNPACQRILTECKKLGYIQGQWKKDNGLWKDCFDPIVKGGGTPTRDGKSMNVPVSPSDMQACRAAEGQK